MWVLRVLISDKAHLSKLTALAAPLFDNSDPRSVLTYSILLEPFCRGELCNVPLGKLEATNHSGRSLSSLLSQCSSLFKVIIYIRSKYWLIVVSVNCASDIFLISLLQVVVYCNIVVLVIVNRDSCVSYSANLRFLDFVEKTWLRSRWSCVMFVKRFYSISYVQIVMFYLCNVMMCNRFKKWLIKAFSHCF